MAIQDVYRVRTVLNGWQGGPGLSTAYFDTAGTPSSGDALAAVNRVRSAWDAVKGALSNVTTAQVSGIVDMIEVQEGELTGGFSVTTPALVTGNGGAGTGPAQVAGGLVLDTGHIIRGRRLRGRLFFAPLSAAQTGAVLPPSGLNTALAAFSLAIITASPPATPPLVVWSRPIFDKVTHALITPGSQFPVIAGAPAAKFFSIRSRRD